VFISVGLNPFIPEVLIARELARNVFVTADSKLIAEKWLPEEQHTHAEGRQVGRMPRGPTRSSARTEARLRTGPFWARPGPGIEEAEKEYHRIRKGGGWEFGEWRRVIFVARVNGTVRIRTYISGKPQIPRAGLPS
jgi:hypothetical protein